MRLEMLTKDGDSGEQGCDSFYLGEDGRAYIQAQEGGPDVYAAAVNLLPGERIVGIDIQVILNAVQRYRART